MYLNRTDTEALIDAIATMRTFINTCAIMIHTFDYAL